MPGPIYLDHAIDAEVSLESCKPISDIEYACTIKGINKEEVFVAPITLLNNRDLHHRRVGNRESW